MKAIKSKVELMFLVLIMVSLVGCGYWSKNQYDEIISIKNTALELVEKSSTEQFSANKGEVDALNIRIQKVIDDKKPKRGAEMLYKIRNKNTWGAFIIDWENRNTLSPVMASNRKLLIEMAFDEALGLGYKGAGK
jgi:hypothetical protein